MAVAFLHLCLFTAALSRSIFVFIEIEGDMQPMVFLYKRMQRRDGAGLSEGGAREAGRKRKERREKEMARVRR